MRITFLLFCFIALCFITNAQEKLSLYGEAGGAGPVMSVNLDKRFDQ